MQNKTRFISVLLTAIMTLSFINASALENSSAKKIKSDQIPEFLNTFGFITSEQKTKELTENVSRGEFAKIAVKLLGNVEYSNKNVSQPFVDVPLDHEFFGDILTLYNYNCISGYEDNSFMPDENINPNHAAQILLNVLGYGKVISGGTLTVQQLISSKDLFNNISSGAYLTRGNAYKMIYNALCADIGDIDTYNIVDDSVKVRTLLSDRFDIYSVKGIVSDDGFTGYTGMTKLEPGYILIDDIEYKVDIEQDKEQPELGNSINAFYKIIDDEYVIKYFYTDERNNMSLLCEADNIISFDGVSKYKIYLSDNQSKTDMIYLDPTYKVIYNGISFLPTPDVTNDDFINMMSPRYGSVKFIDNNKDEKYDIVFVTNYTLMVVGGKDRLNKILYDKNDITHKIELEDVDNLTIYDANDYSREMAFERISADYIVYVALSFDNSYGKILVSQKTVTGRASKISEDEIVVGEETFERTDEFDDFVSANPIPSQNEIVWYLSPENKVVFYKVSGNESSICHAYIAKAIYTDEEVGVVRLYTDANEYKPVTCADTVVADGKKFSRKTHEQLIDYINRHKYGVGSIALVKFNEEGLLTYIDMAYNPNDTAIDDATGEAYRYPRSGENEDSWQIAKDITGYAGPENYKITTKFLSYSVTNGMIANRLAMDVDTLVFKIPLGGNPKDCFVTHTSDIQASDSSIGTSVTAYVNSADSIVADVISMNQLTTTGFDMTYSGSADIAPYYVVTDVEQCINNFDELSYKLTVYYKQDYYDFYTNDIETGLNAWYGQNEDGSLRTKTVQIGDVVKIGTDKNSNIPSGQIRIMYSPATDKDTVVYRESNFVPYPSYTPITPDDYKGVKLLWINKIVPKYIEFAFVDPATNPDYTQKRLITDGAVNYLIFEKGKVYLSDATKLVSYEQCHNNIDCRAVVIGESKADVIYMINDEQ